MKQKHDARAYFGKKFIVFDFLRNPAPNWLRNLFYHQRTNIHDFIPIFVFVTVSVPDFVTNFVNNFVPDFVKNQER